MGDRTGKNASETAQLIWDVANSLFGPFKPHEYGLVILPMCVIKRFHDCLKDTAEKVRETNVKLGKMDATLKDGFLKQASGYAFYNTSDFDFNKLVSAPNSIADNFEDYLHGFSSNVEEILVRMNFADAVARMKEAGLLYQVISDFNSKDLDMSPENIKTEDMGYIFENLIQRFSESYDEEAGSHFTSKDIIEMMTDLLVEHSSTEKCSVYDMTMGTSQMLTCMEARIKKINPNAIVDTYGQEFNAFTMGIAAADALIHGGTSDNMRYGDTLSDDKFDGYSFDFVISNPPFGIDWKREAKAVEDEYKKGAEGRFEAGLPSKSDGQMLFLQNGLAKLKDTGRMAIIQNGSSLFNGDAGSGPSDIRKHIITHDWLDAIVQMPSDSFYNTNIATYVWLIDKAKAERTPGKVLLIDASACMLARKKSIGKKRADISPKCRELILKAYREYTGGTYTDVNEAGKEIIVKAKLMDNDDFGYRKVTVETPLKDETGKMVLKKGKPIPDSSKRDTEIIPLKEKVNDYINREVMPYNKEAWVDDSKEKIGYEIPFTRTFYEYVPLEDSDIIAARIEEHEKNLMSKLHKIFAEG